MEIVSIKMLAFKKKGVYYSEEIKTKKNGKVCMILFSAFLLHTAQDL